MQGGYRGLDLVSAGTVQRQRRLQDAHALGDLSGGQTADRAQGECHLGGRGEVRAGAAEEQEEGVIAFIGGRRRRRRLGIGRLLAPMAGGLAAAGIDQPAGAGRRW
ncbi:MAG TPA: hypothetical protein VIK04_19070 [Solirubrobacteraceae bacterium]